MSFAFLMMMKAVFTVIILSLTSSVTAESHTVRFNNQCGRGSPVLLRGGQILSNGQDYTSDGPLSSAIAYLQTGDCLLNGENCAIVEMTLGNPTCPGCGSSVDISLIAPHALNVPTSFSYFGGCDGMGATCDSPSCSSAFFQPNDNQVQVACQTDNVNLLITFCGTGPSSATLQSSQSSAPSSAHHTTAANTAGQASHSSSLAASLTTAPTPTITPTYPPKSEPTLTSTHSVALPPTVASLSASSQATTSSALTCRRVNRSKKRTNAHVHTAKTRIEPRESYDTRIRAIAGHARTYSGHSLAGHQRV